MLNSLLSLFNLFCVNVKSPIAITTTGLLILLKLLFIGVVALMYKANTRVVTLRACRLCLHLLMAIQTLGCFVKVSFLVSKFICITKKTLLFYGRA
jgi:cbb3-type cytochrome oxidase subunit 3